MLCIGVAAPIPAGAQSQIQPIVIRPDTDHQNCQIYLKADGSRLLFKGKPISASGACPSDYMRGTVTRFGADTYRLQGFRRRLHHHAGGTGPVPLRPGRVCRPPLPRGA